MGDRPRLQENQWVVKANELVTASHDLSVTALRLLHMAIAQISMYDEDFRPIHVYISDYKQLTGGRSENVYEEAKMLGRDFLNLTVEVEVDGQWKGRNVLAAADYQEGEGYLRIEFSEQLRPFLLDLDSGFTRFRIGQTMQISSTHAVRIYELCKKAERPGADRGAYWTVSVDHLRRMLRLEEKYDRFTDFRRYVLDKARRQVNRHTDIWIEYEQLRSGQRTTHIRFWVRTDDRVEQPDTLPGPSGQADLFGGSDDRPPAQEWYESLPADRQEAVRERALGMIPKSERNEELEYTLQFQINQKIRQIWEGEDQPDPIS